MSIHKSFGSVITGINSILPQQHTDYWRMMRGKRVGGSEIASILGINPYEEIVDSVKKKVFPNIVNRNIGSACSWGNLFETVIRKHCEFIYKTVIYETGSIPSSINQAMSPDGLGLVKLIDEDGVVRDRPVLFEYKTAFGRGLVPGKMPNYYIPQVLCGLETISICDLCIYVEAVVRMCPLKIPGHTKYYTYKFPQMASTVKYPDFETPHCWGAIAFVKTGKTDNTNPVQCDYDKIIAYFEKNGLIDFGDEGKDIMDSLFACISEKFIEPHYIYQQHPEEDPQDLYSKSDLIDETKELKPLGIMRWKMIQTNIVYIKPREFLPATEKYAQLVNDCVLKCQNTDLINQNKLINETAALIKQILKTDTDVLITEEFSNVKEKKKYVKKDESTFTFNLAV